MRMASRRRIRLAPLVVGILAHGPLLASARDARAQSGAAAGGAAIPPQKTAPLILGKDAPWTHDIDEGHARMRAGDCVGAVNAFDRALNNVRVPSVNRDRGLCHERLGDVYPAIDDFRVYLYAQPDAADADDIRARLAKLETDAGQGASLPRKATAQEDPFAKKADGKGEAAASATASEGETSLDAEKEKERLQSEAETSALRLGRGVVVGAHADFRRWADETMGWGQTLALDLRYSFSRTSTLLGELGYSNVNGGGGATSAGGALVFVGYEARIPLERRMTHALYLGGGAGYEHLENQGTRLVHPTLLPRARVGYRYVAGPSLGLEAGVDAGPAILFTLNPPAGADTTSVTFMGGLHLGVMLAP